MKFNVKKAPVKPLIKAGQLWRSTINDSVYLVIRHSIAITAVELKQQCTGGRYTLVRVDEGFNGTYASGINTMPDENFEYIGMLEVEQ